MGLSIEYANLLENNAWFYNLPIHLKKNIVTYSMLHEYEKGQRVFFSGDSFNGFYAVLSGAVHLGYVDIDGKEAVIAIIEPIMWFGEISLVDLKPRSHDAVCIKKSIILYISNDHIQQILQSYPEFWFHISQLIIQKVRFAFMELGSLQLQSMTQRIAQRLLFISNGYGNHCEKLKNSLNLSQEQLAQMLNCSRQTINQELKKLERNNVLKISFTKIEILDFSKLYKIANCSN